MINEQELMIEDIIQRTHNVKSFRMEVHEKSDFKAGQYMHVMLKKNKELSRYLSISNSPTEEDYIEFTKKLTNSDFSRTLEALKIGDMVDVKYPFGRFTFEGEYEKIAFLSGGIGITPIRSICKYIVDTKLNTDIVLIYGNQSVEDIVFKDDFNLMQKQSSNLKVVHVLCDDTNCDLPVKIGYITREIVEEAIPDYAERKFFVCGPPAMVDAMKKILMDELGLTKDSLILENFKGY